MNAGIQGLAADIFKVALVRLDHELEVQTSRRRLILQVHDEVIVEVRPHEHDACRGPDARSHGGGRGASGTVGGAISRSAPRGPTRRGEGAADMPSRSGSRCATAPSALRGGRSRSFIFVFVHRSRSCTSCSRPASPLRPPTSATDSCTPTRTWNLFPPGWECQTTLPASSKLSGPERADAGPLVRAGGRSPRFRIPALLVHEGHRARGRVPGRRARARAGQPGARRRMRTGTARARARGIAASRSSASTSRSDSSTSRRARRPARRHVPAHATPAHIPFADAFDAAVSLCQGAFGARRAPERDRRRARRDGPRGRARRARRGERVLVVLPGAVPEERRTFDADTGVHHEHTRIKDEAGRPTPRSSCGPPATPRASSSCSLDGPGSSSIASGRSSRAATTARGP